MQGMLDLNNPFVAPAAGALVALFGLAMLISHVVAWKKQRDDPGLEPAWLGHYRARYRRRMQASGLIVLLGVMIPVGDWLFALKQPLVSTVYWMVVLLLTGWLVVLALGDMWATSAQSRKDMARLKEQQRLLEQQLAQLKAPDSNGKKPSG